VPALQRIEGRRGAQLENHVPALDPTTQCRLRYLLNHVDGAGGDPHEGEGPNRSACVRLVSLCEDANITHRPALMGRIPGDAARERIVFEAQNVEWDLEECRGSSDACFERQNILRGLGPR